MSHDTLTQLGANTQLPSSPDAAVLETFENPALDSVYSVRFTCPEFTSLCPKTGQPDFGIVFVDYVPAAKMIESKSLKLFLHSFRNHGAFHESCTLEIAHRLYDVLDPQWIRVATFWYPRGGIPIDCIWQSSAAPTDVYILPLDIKSYRARF